MLSQSYNTVLKSDSDKSIAKNGFRSFRSSSTSSHPSLFRTRSLQRLSEENKAIKVRFYRNGDKFYQGLVYAISKCRFRTFEVLLADLTVRLADKANLPQGVRVVFTIDGKKKINSIEELEAGESYVCASNDGFKKIDYLHNINPNWCGNVRASSSMSIKLKKKQDRGNSWILDDLKNFASQEFIFKSNQKESRDFVRPKLVSFIRSGVKPRKVIRMLLNKKTAHSLEQVFNDLTKVIKLDTGAVRKVYTLKGKQVLSLHDFFKENSIFVAYGQEKPSPDDFIIDTDESKLIQPSQSSPQSHSVKRNLTRKGSERLNNSMDRDSGHNHKAIHRRAYSLRAPAVPRKPRSTGYYVAPSRSSEKWPRQLSERYVIGDVIGDGHFAEVRECVEKCSKQKFALKIIDKSKCIGKEHMIVNEVSILRRIKHPNVVRLIQEFDTTSEIYLVMELVNGGDLFDAISSASRYTERDASGMLHNLASALSHLHKLKIAHRDIKPENLLVYCYEDGSKALKLADFGLATVVSSQLYTVCGTPTYVAPEIILQTGYGVKVDVWAAGVITYILLCGYPPFRSESNSQEELFDAILEGDLNFPSPYWDHISQPARDLIGSMLQVDPGLRISADDILEHTWLSDEVFCNRDMKSSVSSKLSNLRTSEKSSLSSGRKRRINIGARILANCVKS